MKTEHIDHIIAGFTRLGARLKVEQNDIRLGPFNPLRIDVKTDQKGEYFEILVNPRVHHEVGLLDLQPKDRHLLLFTKDPARPRADLSRLLCGHDERHWFVAAVPSGTTVMQAKESLKPTEVRAAQEQAHLKTRDAHRRKNAAFVRQGEWFFIPCPGLEPDPRLALKNEPIRRGGSKPHIVQQLFRRGGTTVYVCRAFPSGLTHAQYAKLVATKPETRHFRWFPMVSNPEAFAKGAVRHPDHHTIHLHYWHKILLNQESAAAGNDNVAFLD